MSDPVTNVEIEDVLSSIRRLVSDGDKARTRDPAPIEAAEPDPVKSVPDTSSDSNAAPQNDDPSDRLVLTPAFLVVDGDNDRDAPMHDTYDDGADDDHDNAAEAESEDWQEEEWPEASHEDDGHNGDVADDTEILDAVSDAIDEDAQDAPLSLTDPVLDDAVTDTDATADDAAPVTDRSGLVATIAELEAAISEGADDFEPDDSETMGQTIAWPGTAVQRASETIEDADVAEETGDETPEASEQDDDEPAFEHREAQETSAPVQEAVEDSDDDYDDLDGLLDVGGATLDEAALREMVADVVREELTGPMGERITRNVRKLVRREIYRILSSQEFD